MDAIIAHYEEPRPSVVVHNATAYETLAATRPAQNAVFELYEHAIATSIPKGRALHMLPKTSYFVERGNGSVALREFTFTRENVGNVWCSNVFKDKMKLEAKLDIDTLVAWSNSLKVVVDRFTQKSLNYARGYLDAYLDELPTEFRSMTRVVACVYHSNLLASCVSNQKFVVETDTRLLFLHGYDRQSVREAMDAFAELRNKCINNCF
jgi:hypothetical protein